MSADSDRRLDVYERAAGTTTLISTGPDGGDDAFDAFFRGGSLDGSRVFLTTRESLVSADETRARTSTSGGRVRGWRSPGATEPRAGPGLALSGRRIQRLGGAVTVVARATTGAVGSQRLARSPSRMRRRSSG